MEITEKKTITNIMKNTILSKIIEFLEDGEKFGKFLLLNKKFYNLLINEWKCLQNDKYYIDRKNNFYSKKNSPEYTCINIRRYISCHFERMYYYYHYVYKIYIDLSPVYPGHELIVRFTSDNWKSYQDIRGKWCKNEENVEKWVVYISTEYLKCHSPLKYAVKVIDIRGREFWENNNWKNYELDNGSNCGYNDMSFFMELER